MKRHKITFPGSVICHSLGWLSWHPLWVSSCYTIRPKGAQKSQATKIAAVESTVVIGPMPMPKACSNWNADVRLGNMAWHVGLSKSVNRVGWRWFSSSKTCPEMGMAGLEFSFFKRLAASSYQELMQWDHFLLSLPFDATEFQVNQRSRYLEYLRLSPASSEKLAVGNLPKNLWIEVFVLGDHNLKFLSLKKISRFLFPKLMFSTT